YYHGQVLREWIQLKKNVQVSRLKNRLLWKEQIELQECCEDVKRLFKEIHEKICDPCAEQIQEEDNMDERLKNLLKQKEVLTQQRELAEKLQHQFNISEMRPEETGDPKGVIQGCLNTLVGLEILD
ncbi:putative disks large-like protein, partial [Cricetulus griseus]